MNQKKRFQQEMSKSFDRLDNILEAVGMAVGAQDVLADMQKRTVSFKKIRKDNTRLKALYQQPEYKPLIDKFFEIGGIDSRRFGIGG